LTESDPFCGCWWVMSEMPICRHGSDYGIEAAAPDVNESGSAAVNNKLPIAPKYPSCFKNNANHSQP
jgi:hypothetical protein